MEQIFQLKPQAPCSGAYAVLADFAISFYSYESQWQGQKPIFQAMAKTT
ncbi:MAG: hypothetical protein U0X92_03070 [Anaerolineales bacterium]